jgi:hypothetical protein
LYLYLRIYITSVFVAISATIYYYFVIKKVVKSTTVLNLAKSYPQAYHEKHPQRAGA